jgi:hypothetical protein
LIQPPDFKVILDSTAAALLNRLSHNLGMIQLGAISISTQGLAGNMFKPQSSPRSNKWYSYLLRGQVQRYETILGELAFTDMSNKGSLMKFYDAGPKILIRRVISRQDRLLSSFFKEKMVFKKDINPFILTDKIHSLYYVLGILNSRLISYLYINSSSIATKDDFRQTTLAELRRLPVRTINFEDAADKARHDRIVSLVEQMLAAKVKHAKATTESEKNRLEIQIEALDRQIDEAVYELYGLTEEEIKIVEA